MTKAYFLPQFHDLMNELQLILIRANCKNMHKLPADQMFTAM